MPSDAFLIGEKHTIRRDGTWSRTPLAVTNNDLAFVVAQLAARAEGNNQDAIAVLMEGRLARRIGIDVDNPTAENLAPHLERIRLRGWKVAPVRDVVHPFIRAYGHEAWPDVHIGIIPWVRDAKGDYPLYDGLKPIDVVQLMSQWQDLTGIPYSTRPGLLAHNILRRSYEGRIKKIKPTWVPDVNPDTACPIDWTCEAAHDLSTWVTPSLAGMTEPDGLVELDANGAYLGAYIGQEFARYGLRNTGRIQFDKKLAGYWDVELFPWNDPLFPHPAGVGPSRRWVTTQTLDLLTSLKEEGKYGGFTIYDSWTSRAFPVLRPMGECLRDIVYTPGLAQPLKDAAKASYKEFHGMCVSPRSRTRRGDWYSAVRAAGRVTLWRRAWRAYQAEGVAPVAFHVDAVYYRPGEVPSESAYPAGKSPFPRGDRLGQFKEQTV